MKSVVLMELSSRQWVVDSKGSAWRREQRLYKKRGYWSPDEADATILCFYTPHPRQAISDVWVI